MLCVSLVLVLASVGSIVYSDKISVPNLIRSNGYEFESHHVLTDDGYVLELHRIPNGRNESSFTRRRRAIILGHGLLCDSSVFVFQGPKRSLAYILADNGFDVWMLNARGTGTSKHVNLSTKNTKFWQFSWHEMSIYDLPATIDYVLKTTGEIQVDYLGFSMGTTLFFVLMIEKPGYNSKIRKMVALAPVAFLNQYAEPIFLRGERVTQKLVNFTAKTGMLKFPGDEFHMNEMLVTLCKPQNLAFFKYACYKILETLGGANNGNINPKELPFFMHYYPSQTSVRTHVHFEQLRESGKFAKYNFGRKLNKKMYGRTQPPNYDLSRVISPVNLIWSRADFLVDYQSTVKLHAKLPNIEFSYEVSHPNFSHADFILANNAHSLVYGVALERLLS